MREDPSDRPVCAPPDVRDRGATLVELLVSVVLTSMLTIAISTAFIVILRTEPPTNARISESNDISFVQTYLPNDLATAVELHKAPTHQPPSATLPGTNVVTMRRPAGDGSSGTYQTISYRYLQVGEEWHLVRFAQQPDGSYRRNTVARELPAPPDGWQPDQPATHAIEITARNQIILRPVGEDVTVRFESGNSFVTGGGGMSAENELPPGAEGGLVDPSAPPSRCGRTVTLVLDTSGSVPDQSGGAALQDAAVGFIDAFTGTPSRVSVLGFDRSAYAMYPATPGQYVGLLNPSAELSSARTRILAIDDMDGRWPGGGASLGARDPNGDGVMWDQTGSGTNWEDGIHAAFMQDAPGSPLLGDLPELVVLITDGQPTRGRNPDGSPTGELGAGPARDRAKAVAAQGRDTGARVIGVLVGRESTKSAPVNNLKAVVGSVPWDGTGPDDVGNAATADYFTGSFAELGDVLRSIMIAECGGTVTLQKRIDATATGGGPRDDATGVWTYTSQGGVLSLDRSREAAITFDYTFDGGQVEKEVQITETPKAGFVFDRAECSANGVPFDASRVSAPAGGVPGVVVRIRPDEAVSCLMISRPA